MIRGGQFFDHDAFLTMSPQQWQQQMDPVNYLRAWSLVYYLIYADNGKHAAAFNDFMHRLGQGEPWIRAMQGAFGSVDGFIPAWQAYWENLDPNVCDELYLAATMRRLSAFIVRAEMAGALVDTLEDLRRLSADGAPPMPLVNWIPPVLVSEALEDVARRSEAGAGFEIQTLWLPRTRRGKPQPHLPPEERRQLLCIQNDKRYAARWTIDERNGIQVTLYTGEETIGVDPPAEQKGRGN
jgi:hypothetical protein